MKLKFNQVILVVAILIVVSWNIMRSRRIEKLESVTTASDVVLYVQSREEPNPFITHDLAKKLTSDNTKLEKVLQLAGEKKKIELLEFVKTL